VGLVYLSSGPETNDGVMKETALATTGHQARVSGSKAPYAIFYAIIAQGYLQDLSSFIGTGNSCYFARSSSYHCPLPGSTLPVFH